VVLEETLESPLDCKEIKPVSPKGNQYWIIIGRTDSEAEVIILGHLMWRTDSFEKILMPGKIEGRRRRGWHGWMASPTWWAWVWVSSRSWWWTGKPGLQQSMGSQGVRHDWATELNWTELRIQLNPPQSYNSSGVFWFVSSRLPKKQESYLLCWARVKRNGHGLWSQAQLNLYCSSSTHCLCGLWPLTEPLWAFFFNEADIKIPHRTFWGSKMIVDVMFLV